MIGNIWQTRCGLGNIADPIFLDQYCREERKAIKENVMVIFCPS